ncbi:hypothetical protein [Dinghuibacter silviterrae]|uniref:Outer membrane protein with beta-barrel domain n=1 Tax=Dinghuibacter silviterrae TaxID=1539049 RepID=A0A4R8DU49_9BACT|nr:hypothetical protein [Dinghuibacter silviterrae]TDX00975.1 hypothetical protein EDB95_2006 [Dinghuibacter silviterrae]
MRYFVLAALLAACCTFAHPAAAQEAAQGGDQTYQNAVGVTFGWWNGASLSLKHFIKDDAAIEVRASFYQYGGELCGLYQFYGDFGNVAGLRWYAGGGAHAGAYNNRWTKNYPSRPDGVYLGPDGVLGVDYKFDSAPIDLSFDIQPRVDIPGGYFNVWGGLGVRFAF